MCSKSTKKRIAKKYLEKTIFLNEHIKEEVDTAVFNFIVIPCYNEHSLAVTINSLYACAPPKRPVEIIIVINSSILDNNLVLNQNDKTVEEVLGLKKTNTASYIRLNYILVKNLPAKHAGVGLARKIGLDEAVYRFNSILDRSDEERLGVLTCLDADCTVDKNYLVEIEKHFMTYSTCPGVSIKYLHELTEDSLNIAKYELHLRYYNQALLYAGFPFAFHTVGSSMAVSVRDYQRQGGMNRRKAGEDFYFLHKFIKLDGFAHISSTYVIPSGRESDRVPFGTGRAMMNMKSKSFVTYRLQHFKSLKLFVECVALFYKDRVEGLRAIEKLPSELLSYLGGVSSLIEELKSFRVQSSGEITFRKRFFSRFDAFWVMKYLNLRRMEDGGGDVLAEANALMKLIPGGKEALYNVIELLRKYRQLERE